MPVPIVGRATKAAVRRKPRLPDPGEGAEGVFGGGDGAFFEDFKADYNIWGGFSNTATSSDPSRRIGHFWGETSKGEHLPDGNNGRGTVKLWGSYNGVGLMSMPSGIGNGFGQGLFEACVRLTSDTGTVGDNSGPAVVLWPADDIWINPAHAQDIAQEVDICEIDWQGDVYYATHWYAPGWSQDNGWALYYVRDMPDPPAKTFYEEFHIFAAFLQADKLRYYLDGRLVGTDAERRAPDFANGGLNHTLGFMNRSSNTTIECDWLRWTPEATMIAKLSGGDGGTGPPPGPRSITLDPVDPLGAHPTWSTTLYVTGIARVVVKVQNPEEFGWTYESTQEYTVPSSGVVHVTVTFTRSGQFLEISDAADNAFRAYSYSSFW